MEGPTLNVFKGPKSLLNYFDPDLQPPVPLVEIPDKLNPFRCNNVRVYAKMLTALPAQNVKALPAMNMLLNDPSARSKSIVEASSGSTALSLAMLSRVLYDNEDVCAFLTNKKHPDQLKMLRFFGLKISLYGGLAQQEPVDPRGIMCRLRQLAKEDEQICYPGQYDNDHNWKSHSRWTGPQILKQLPEINILCTTVGTGGCITGTGVYLKSLKPAVKIIGIVNNFGDPTPGPRHFEGFDSSQFPWRETIDSFEHVASKDSYEWSMKLSREGLVCGPSSGEALCGLYQFLNKRREEGTLKELADPASGDISCVFICCDLPYQYIDSYFQKLGKELFPPIFNENLLKCDQDRYDERWELNLKEAYKRIVSQKKRNGLLCSSRSCNDIKPRKRSKSPKKEFILDLRQQRDFDAVHVCGSVNSPLEGLSSSTGDIFGDSEQIESFWTKLRAKFNKDPEQLGSKKFSLIVICYDGETSRLATSILRAKSYNAYSVLGGFQALGEYIKTRK